MSDAKGHFLLTVPASTNSITISAEGYISEDFDISKSNNLSISLTETYSNLNDVVVIGYGTARKKDLTGAVVDISEKDFNKGNFASPDQLIQGKASGVDIINNNGTPGGAATIMIRGNAALNGTGQPLYVIDGVPLDGRSIAAGDNATNPQNNNSFLAGSNPLNFLNTDDIASIEILKDASATAIYGSRASFGVVLINTKKGQVGQPKLDVATSIGVSSIMKKIDVLNATEYRNAIKYYNVSPLNDLGSSADALGAILQNGLQQNYSLAVSGGNESGKYKVSGNYLNQDGIIINTGFKKYAIDLSTNFRFLKTKRLGLDINLISSQYLQTVPLPATGADFLISSALQWNPTKSLRNPDGTLSINAGDDPPNPVALADYLKNNLKVTTILASVSPYYKFTDWLEYRMLYSVNYSTSIDRFSLDVALNPYNPTNPGGQVYIANNELTTQQFTNTITFDKNLSSALHLTALAGYEYTNFGMKGYNLNASGDPSVGGFGSYGLDYTNYIQYSFPGSRQLYSFANPTSELQSFFARTIFNLNEKYLLTATFRADGSSKFGANNKYGYFPSFAMAWNINKEKFFNSDFVNLLKLRIGWGETGNQEFPPGASQARYAFQPGPSILQINNPNPDLKWQSDQQYDIGVDFSILHHRISGTIDYFHKTTTDLLYPSQAIQPAPPQSTIRWINLDGEIINKGLEVLINISAAQKKSFSVDVSVNATFISNTVSGLPAPIYTGNLSGSGVSGDLVEIIKNGLPMNAFYTREYLGIDKSTGQSVYVDSGNTFHYVGNPNPTTLLGLSATFRYKKLSLLMNMFGAFGQHIFDNTSLNVINVGGINVGRNIGVDVFHNPVKESIANPVTPSSRYVEKGDYLKMANLTLSYNVGDIKNVCKGMNIYLTARNLFILTGFKGFDPEVNADRNNNGVPSLGISYVEYPTARTINAGINFSL
jgi:iron complex outermembrane receptor protein